MMISNAIGVWYWSIKYKLITKLIVQIEINLRYEYIKSNFFIIW
jgi:hypothetical protein